MIAIAVPLRHLADVLVSNVDKKTVQGQHPVRLVNYTDVYYQDRIGPHLRLMSATATEEQARRFALRAGDSIITKDSETAVDIAVPAYVAETKSDMICGYHLAIIRPHATVDGRFMAWALRSDFVRGQYSVAANGMTRYGLTYDAIRSAVIPTPSLGEQKRIADFLDDQVARIDNIVAARTEQVGLAREAEETSLEGVLWATDEVAVSLRRLGTQVTTGPFGTVFSASEYVAGGVPMINPTHIFDGEIWADGQHSVSADTANRLVRHQLREGDIVTGRKGDLGRAAVVKRAQDGWICGSDAIAIHSDRSRLVPGFLDLILHLPRVRSELVSRSPGATMPSLNEGMLLSVEIPDVSIGEQLRRSQVASRLREDYRIARGHLSASSEILQNLKRSLIAAAVTGQFDVNSADGSRVQV